MNASELRIGNKLIRPNGNIATVTWGVIKDIELGDNTYKPIPLTEEWLVKFGWIWNQECNSYEKYPNGDARMNLAFKEISVSYTMFNYVIKALIAEGIYYVHQLQNLYFSLTGEELETK